MNHDALTEILRMTRLEGTIFSRAEVDAPWSVSTRGAQGGIFHAIVEGKGWVCLEPERDWVCLEQGDIVFFPHGSGHILCSAVSVPPRSIRELIHVPEGQSVGMVKIEGLGPRTSLICGRFSFYRSDVHPLLSMLPQLLHYRPSDSSDATWVQLTTQLILRELHAVSPGALEVIARLTDILLIHALRYYISGLTPGTGGWLGGLRDAQVSRAMGLIHASPQEKWDVGTLARRVGLSRSAFFSRFTELIGEPPLQYLTRWRMFLAAQALREEDISLAEIAERIGYASEFAFSKAFKRCVGEAPAYYRRYHRTPEPASASLA